jgi:hypothetical protein
MVEEPAATPLATPPPEDIASAVATPSLFRICLTEDFVTSEMFDSLPAVLQGCHGEHPVEISIARANGQRRRWQIQDIKVNPKNLSVIINALPGASLEE